MIDKLIPQVDKLKHFYLWTIGFLLLSIPLLFVFHHIVAMYISYCATVLTTGAKEVIKDYYLEQGKPEWLDFWFSILAPSLIMVLYICLINL